MSEWDGETEYIADISFKRIISPCATTLHSFIIQESCCYCCCRMALRNLQVNLLPGIYLLEKYFHILNGVLSLSSPTMHFSFLHPKKFPLLFFNLFISAISHLLLFVPFFLSLYISFNEKWKWHLSGLLACLLACFFYVTTRLSSPNKS